MKMTSPKWNTTSLKEKSKKALFEPNVKAIARLISAVLGQDT